MKTTIQQISKHLTLCLCLSFILSSTANAALVSRLGGQAVYDDVLDITWLADANLASTNTFGVAGINTSGSMNWNEANQWIANMNADGVTGYLGINTWRQPTVSPLNGSSFNLAFTYDGSSDRGYQLSAPVDATNNPAGQSAGFTGSELAYHYYNNLGAVGVCHGTNPGSGNGGCVSPSIYGVDDATNTANLALFGDSIINSLYKTSTELAPGSSSALFFDAGGGFQGTSIKLSSFFVWAVAPGDVAPVPVPAPVWLMGSALLGLVGIGRRKRRHLGS